MRTEPKTIRKAGQLSLFEIPESVGVSIDVAATRLGVSSATIRNWLKTGYLSAAGNGRIDVESLDSFLREHAGKQKLTSRANKSQKDSHDHSEVSARFISRIVENSGDLHVVGTEYQAALSDSHRNKEGIYYTPESIVADMLRPPREDVSSKTFCDPCCGSGNFIVRALEVGFKPENIVGCDTDPVAVELTKGRILALSGYDSRSIYNESFLDRAIRTDASYDYVFTNPPWGKKLFKDRKDFYASIFHAGKSNDTCSLFFFACLKSLKYSGRLGFLLPEAFFNIAMYETARRAALNLKIERLVDYDKPFKGLLTRAQAIVLDTKKTNDTSHPICCEFSGNTHLRENSTFRKNPNAILNFKCNSNDSAIIDRAFSVPHITLEGRARWGLGIVTGNNKKFVKHTPAEGYIAVFKGADLRANELKKPHCFIPSDLSLYQQVAPVELYEANEKLIYKFISSDLCFFTDSKQRYVLNSANMLIPNRDFPISCQQLACLLNSRFINFIFRSTYNTHKVLRGDLEMLPIHVDYFDQHEIFEEESYLNHLGIKKGQNGAYRVKE